MSVYSLSTTVGNGPSTASLTQKIACLGIALDGDRDDAFLISIFVISVNFATTVDQSL